MTAFDLLHNLLNQLSYIHSTVTYKRVQRFDKGDSSNRQKMNGRFLHQVLRQNLSWFLS